MIVNRSRRRGRGGEGGVKMSDQKSVEEEELQE